MKRCICIFVFSIFTGINSFAQDSLNVSKCDTCHSVRKATLLSAVVPGAGQIYNHFAQPKGHKKAFWKVPLIYAGLGGASYLLIKRQSEVLSLRKEYYFRKDNDGQIQNLKWQAYEMQGLLSLENQKSSQRDFSILGLFFIYALQVADAAVEAHFVSFDVSEDLTMRFSPKAYSRNTVGLSLQFNFR